jgi:hypothetical protein
VRLTTPRSSENGPWPAIIVLAITHRARRKAARLSGLSRQRFSALAQFVITKYRDKVQEVALRERIRTVIRQVCKELGVQIVSGVFSRENMSICWWKSRRIIPSATSCGASRDAHHVGCRGSSRTQAHLGTAFLGARLPSPPPAATLRTMSSISIYRRQPVGIQLLQVNPVAAPRRDHRRTPRVSPKLAGSGKVRLKPTVAGRRASSIRGSSIMPSCSLLSA